MDTSKGIVFPWPVCVLQRVPARTVRSALSALLDHCSTVGQQHSAVPMQQREREGDKGAESRVLGLIGVEHRPLAVAVSVAVILAPAVTVTITLAPAAAMATGHGLDLDELVIGPLPFPARPSHGPFRFC